MASNGALVVLTQDLRVLLYQGGNLTLATIMASNSADIIIQDGGVGIYPWGNMLYLTSYVASMVVNALVTGLIAFKILKVFLEVKQTFGSLNSTRGPKLQRIIFIIIESGMALFAIQLVHVVLSILNLFGDRTPSSLVIALDLVIPTHQILNVIIRSVHFYFF